MDENEVVDLVRAAIMLSIELSAPVMLVGLVVGTAIALVQALTQVQEVTRFVPKILAIFLAIFIGLPMMTVSLVEFMVFWQTESSLLSNNRKRPRKAHGRRRSPDILNHGRFRVHADLCQNGHCVNDYAGFGQLLCPW